VWNDEGIAIPVVINSPFRETWWFRAMLGILVIGLVYAGFRYRLARLMAVENLRLRIAQDLHDDVGSTLSAIALTLEQLAKRVSDRIGMMNGLEELRRVAIDKAESLHDLVWTINPRRDFPEDLVHHLKETAHRMLPGIQVHFTERHAQRGRKLTLEVKHNVAMIFREILHNIVLHARAQRVDIDVAEMVGGLRLRVRDDGVGFNLSACSEGNGLVNLQQRARAIGGIVRIESTPGAGTTIVLEVRIT
jgi:signal transduction histidine kinase